MTQLSAILDGLEARGPELVSRLIGAEHNKALSNGKSRRWGRNGSLVFSLAGKHRGRWQDFETGKSGDLLDLIQDYNGGTFPETLQWARDWLHMPDGSRIDGARVDEMRREREARKAEHEAQQEREEAARVEKANRIYAEGRSVSGTVGEKYLRFTRGISLETLKRQKGVIRWHERLNALVVPVTDDEGAATAIQMIAVTPTGEKDSGRAWNPNEPVVVRVKHTLGPMRQGAVRFALAGETIGLAEGVESALSAMQLSGLPVWACLGAGRMHNVSIPETVREIHLFCDADSAGESAANRVRDTNQGRQLVVRTPRGAGTDWNDVLKLLGGVA